MQFGKYSAIILAVSLACLIARADAKAPSLAALARQTMQAYFEKSNGSGCTVRNLLHQKAPSEYNKPAGVFVTLSANGKTRGCWGSVYPEHANLMESTIYATIGAITKDYRYKPIRSSEWQELKTQVTVIEQVVPIENIQSLNPLKDGLLIRAGHKSGVLLPGEAIDATYELVCCKLKAGIHRGEPYQLYKLKAAIYE
jgi:uncharacterized protein (TIGR00296 family)